MKSICFSYRGKGNTAYLPIFQRQTGNRCICGKLSIGFLRLHVKRIECLFLMRYEDFFRTINNEIATMVMRALSSGFKEFSGLFM